MLFVAMSLVSCSDDTEEGPAIISNPEQKVAGTYVGTWTRVLDGEAPVTAQGKVIVDTNDAYVVNITIEDCPDVTLTDMEQALANVCALSDGSITVANPISDNKWGSPFYGKVTNGNLQFAFRKIVKVGRKQYEYSFTFDGNKQ